MRFVVRVTVMLMVGSIPFLSSVPASAAEPVTQLSSYTSDEILWVKTTVDNAAADDLKVKIYSPRKSGEGHRLFQVCKFTPSGAGDYLCGIDVSEGSKALEFSGTWKARSFVADELTSRYDFEL